MIYIVFGKALVNYR